MSTTTSSLLDARRFIDALFGRYFSHNDGYIELRFVGQRTGSKFYRKGDIAENDWEDILRTNQDHNVYFGVNPRPLDRGKKQDDIQDIICLWADLDGKDYEGGKAEAERRLRAFSIPPSITVDSGHGYHCYWVLKEPIVSLTVEQRARLKQILSGLTKQLGADRSKLHLDACLRLPGTINIKDPAAPVECKIIGLTGQVYSLDGFAGLIDREYAEPPAADSPLPAFGKKTKIIRLDDAQSAKADVEGLEISAKTKNLIITGSLLRANDADRTRSGRDFSVICSLVYWDYDYETIHSIFFNPFLGCSNRISSEGETALKWDVQSALRKVHRRISEGTPQSLRIAAIKSIKHLTADQKRQEIGAFIVQDLLTGPQAAGSGFKHQTNENAYFFFDREEKMLMALESTDFYCYMRERFGLAKKDFEEFKDYVKTAIWSSNQTVVPRRFAYWSQDDFSLYLSDNANGVYKLDGEDIKHLDNGVDGVFFDYDPSLSPFALDSNQEAVNYFEPESKRDRFNLDALGFNHERFDRSESLLKKFLVDRASFHEEPKEGLSAGAYRLLLTVYFYSLFFESLMREKPVACFVGTKESGKSFLASSIGKIFFGDHYESTGLPKSPHDLAVVMEKRPYLVIDNLDSYLKNEMLNLLCAVATGATEANRALYTDNDMIWFTPRCFLAITSREPKFTRDDFVSRLLLFNMQKIDAPLSRSELIDSLLQNRSALMTEAIINLNSIVKILLLQEDRKLSAGVNWQPTPCHSRIADWETFGRKICNSATRIAFTSTIQMMNKAKDEFVLEDDPLYQVLNYILFEVREGIKDFSAQDLYSKLIEVSEEMKMEGFKKHYKSARSMAKHFSNIVSELRQKFTVEIDEQSGRRKFYTIMPIDGRDIVFATKALGLKTVAKTKTQKPIAQPVSEEKVEHTDSQGWEREDIEGHASVQTEVGDKPTRED